VTCNTPPANYCVDASYLRQYQSPGTCSNGNCDYSFTNTFCQYGCNGGACNAAQCTSGACCDTATGQFRLSTYQCNASPYATEYGCTGTTCGSDARRRYQYQYCTGSSSTCGTGNLQWAAWAVLEDCSASALCQSNSSNAWCSACTYGCSGSACNSAQCTSGDCCDTATGQYRPSSYQCDSNPYATQYGCTGTACGSDAQLRNQYKYCTGSSATCGTTNLVWGSWQVTDNCATNAICEYSGSNAWCTTCAYGCSGTACVVPQCTSGTCCDTATGQYRPSSYQCNSTPYATEYRCYVSGTCGADGQRRYQYQYCTGSSSTCGTGNLVWAGWTTIADCSTSQICTSTPSSASCTTCTYGCASGTCNSNPCSLNSLNTFDTSALPSGWYLYDGDGYGHDWTWQNASPPPGGSGGYWQCLSDFTPSRWVDDYMVTGSYARTGCSTVTLQFDHYFYAYTDNTDDAWVYISVDGGGWQQVATYSDTTSGHVSLSLTSYLGPTSTFALAFRYRGHYDWYWRIDNISITGS
jgi:hypothetical protein